MEATTGRCEENRIQPGTGSTILTPPKLKFIVYNSEAYYPDAKEYDNYTDAMKAFSELKRSRLENIRCGFWQSCDTDYLAIVISDFCVDEFEKKLLELPDEPLG
jgi:hypothetical protein